MPAKLAVDFHGAVIGDGVVVIADFAFELEDVVIDSAAKFFVQLGGGGHEALNLAFEVTLTVSEEFIALSAAARVVFGHKQFQSVAGLALDVGDGSAESGNHKYRHVMHGGDEGLIDIFHKEKSFEDLFRKGIAQISFGSLD